MSDTNTVNRRKYDSSNLERRMHKSFRLVVGSHLDEFRCPDCGMLLLKGKHLEKSRIEIKCKRCGTLVSSGVT